MSLSKSFVTNTYKLYKKHTDKLAQWLLDTAEKCGYRSENIDSSQETTTASLASPAGRSSRLKGKARKEAKQSETKPSTPPSPPAVQGPTFRIRLNQFIELARTIADNVHKKVVVPVALVKLVRETIDMRRRFSQFYERRTGGIDSANSKHLHFIQTLEEVLKILAPQSGPVESVKVTKTKLNEVKNNSGGVAPEESGEATLLGLDNRFSALELEESNYLDDLEDDQPAASSGGKEKQLAKPHRQVVYYDTGDEEVFFGMYCLFEDLGEIRRQLQLIWKEYKRGVLDLVTASVLTNTAFDLVRRADEEFCNAFPELIAVDPLNVTLFKYVSVVRGVKPDNREFHDDWFNYEIYDVANRLYFPTWILLDAFCRVIKPMRMPQFKQGHFGIYNPKKDRTKMSLREKLAEDKIIIMEMLPEFCLLGQSQPQNIGEDELTRGLRNMYKTKKIPLWLSFATQVFLDITHVLRDQVGEGLNEMRAAGEAAKSVLTYELNAPSHEIWAPQNDEYLEQSISFIDTWMIQDQVDKIRRQCLNSQYADGGVVPPFYLLKRHPLYCGLLKFNAMLTLREVGTTVAQNWGSVLYVAHLYHALRASSLLDVPWPDIELFININTAEKLFVGNLPTTMDDCFKRYNLMMGMAPEVFAKDRMASLARRRGKSMKIHSKKGPRDWLQTSPIVETFKDRYLHQGSVAWSVHNIEALLNENNKSSSYELVHKRWIKSQELNNLELLDALRSAFIVERDGLHYDYFAMHYRCMQLLRTIRNELHHDFVKKFGPNYIENDNQLSSLVGWLLQLARQAEQTGRMIKELRNEKAASQMCMHVSLLMKKLIETEGDCEVKKKIQRDGPS